MMVVCVCTLFGWLLHFEVFRKKHFERTSVASELVNESSNEVGLGQLQ